MSVAATTGKGKHKSAARNAVTRLAPEAHFQLGLKHASQNQWPAAQAAFSAVTAARPADPVGWLNLAHARLKLEDFDGAASAACRAVALDRRSEVGMGIAARCLEHAARYGDLVELLQAADMSGLAKPELHLRLGVALTRLGRFQEAVNAFLEALRRDIRSTEAYALLGNVFQLLKMPEEARESFRNALVLGHAPVEMTSAVLFTSLEASSWAALDEDLRALEERVATGRGQPTPFYALNFAHTRRQLLDAARARAASLFHGIRPLPPRAARTTAGPIRVGFVSSDFHEHATAYLIAELFEGYDHGQLQFHGYSYGTDDGSPMRKRIERAFGQAFLDARQMTTADLARHIRADGIDVLIDLKGYTLFSRNEVFAYRAAPIQVNFLGFPGSLGSTHYDYIVGDPVVTPLEHADGYDEKIAQLPYCYQPNDRQRPVATNIDRACCGLPEQAFVLCCFNANYKITPQVFDIWCALLHQIDDAVLWLFVTNPQSRRNLAAEAERRGIRADRLVWAGLMPLAEHLGRMRNADLFLDTLPVTAHTTASDALWAGLPVLTVAGDSFVSRVAASLLHATGLPELVCTDLDDYARRALALARDRAHLAALRQRLADNRDTCALFDSARYCRDFGALITRMVQTQERYGSPRHLPAGIAD